MTSPELRRRLVLPAGAVHLDQHDSRSTPGFKPGKTVDVDEVGKAAGQQALAALGPGLNDSQRRLWARSRTGSRDRVLVVLQGMDTSGKGGVVRHVGGLLEPQGLRVHAFEAPSKAERRHDFLWRIEPRLPEAGEVAFFDRSHYEDVLVPRVHGGASDDEVERRYGAIQDLEARLLEEGTTLVKCFLHISADTQKERLLARLDDPTKVWKYDPHDLGERDRWADYRAAYEVAMERCGTETTPWYLVPADRKWYRNWAVAQLLHEHLDALDLPWPPAAVDVEAERFRLAQH